MPPNLKLKANASKTAIISEIHFSFPPGTEKPGKLSNILPTATSAINCLLALIKFEASAFLLLIGTNGLSEEPTSILSNNPIPVSVVWPIPLLETPTTGRYW